MMPAKILKSSEFCKNACPKREADAPRITNAISTRISVEIAGLLEDGFNLAEAAEVCIYPFFDEDGGVDSERTYMKQVVQKYCGTAEEDIFNADDKIGLALAQPTKHDDETNDPFAYELYYSYKANDNLTVTPTIFGGTDRDGGTEDVFGALVQTTFKF